MPAYTFADLYKHVDAKPKVRAKKTRIIAIKRWKGQKRFAYLAKSFESYSSPEGHFVSFLYPQYASHTQLKASKGNPLTTRVKVHCTCQAWAFWGSKYLATRDVYNAGSPEKRAADIRDPDGKNFICKHVARLIMTLKGRSFADVLGEFQIKATIACDDPTFEDEVLGPMADDPEDTFGQATAALRTALFRAGYHRDAAEDELNATSPDTLEDVLARHGLLVEDD